ncbi:MAG: hypothetical protein JZD41_05645, partial [Thermoproteus sp.]|nr:hypothetical protein [Thermoproteus sp.]
IRFGNFLLDRYRITALIDLPMRLFDALISTVILLAEKERDESKRENNVVTLIRIPPEVQDVEGVLSCIEGSFNPDGSLGNKLDECKRKFGIYYKTIKQSEIPRNRKWIELFSDANDIINKLSTNKNIVKLEEYFIPSRGNSIWGVWAIHNRKRPDLGAEDFFYFNERKAKQWFSGNMDCLVPAITSSSKINTFKFTNKDWEELKKKDKDVYIFICHHKRTNLPNYVKEYINWGESGECRTKIRETRGGGKKCNEADASKAREKISGLFYGWYDLGGYVPTPIMTIYQPRYHPQFFLCEMPSVTYHAIITLIPKMPVKTSFIYDPVKDFLEKMPEKERKAFDIKMNLSLDEKEIKALLAYMNSTFAWLWLELKSRYIPTGPLGLEVSVLREMPLLDVKRIDRKHVEELAQLFDKLEERARQLQGKTKRSMFMELRPIFREIDLKINEILNLGEDVDRLWDLAVEMMERRIKGTGKVSRPGDISLDEEEERPKRKKGGSGSTPLDIFM